ncbi:hypothetical protein Ais01nite_00230 [Asanoa ishikariensis]|uniref:DUF1707 domain-containing protein n=1 Tax=Asanoa ishikariensis TaxID=137265 RepID=A0A1H3TQ47_9ACTN|nr:DUF1707 domain-containing protein [Asanoa ishikariensis]GIF61988.1 hypothetical protein Ais01nite_00230 [Asanoa ishikariensis]SDZ52423.1 protein of unknown function [Asanoa ishikariensis]
MSAEQRDIRMSDADREGVVARLNTAVSEGRLTMAEFEERVDGVLKARTYGEVEPFVADLPGGAVPAVTGTEIVVELRSHAGQIRRGGRWAVPRKLVVRSKAGMVKLDFRHAVLSQRVVEIELATQAGNTVIVLPPGATADLDRLTTTAGTAFCRVPSFPEPGGTAPHLVISGSSAAGSVIVRYPFRLGRWSW